MNHGCREAREHSLPGGAGPALIKRGIGAPSTTSTRRVYFLLPNPQAAITRDEAIRTASLGREAGLSHCVKLEVIGDERTLFRTTRARRGDASARGEGFVACPTRATIRLSVGSWRTPGRRRSCRSAPRVDRGWGFRTSTTSGSSRFARVPVDCRRRGRNRFGRGAAMELGADGVPDDTAIARSAGSGAMAEAMKLESGRGLGIWPGDSAKAYRARAARRRARRTVTVDISDRKGQPEPRSMNFIPRGDELSLGPEGPQTVRSCALRAIERVI